MQSLLPDLTSPLDQLAAFSVWFRLGPESLADIVSHGFDRRQSGRDVFYTLRRSDIQRFICERKALNRDFQELSPVLDMLASPAGLCIGGDLTAIQQGSVLVEVWHEVGNETEGLLKITGGNKHLVAP